MSTIETKIPARLDRLAVVAFPLACGDRPRDGVDPRRPRGHDRRLDRGAAEEDGSGLGLSASQVLTAGSIYVAGACVGALFFGQLTDRFGRKKLFLVTLVLYLVATVATAFAGSARSCCSTRRSSPRTSAGGSRS